MAIIRRVIDKRIKEKFLMDDAYLNGMAKKCGWQATLVYICLCRHSDKQQESFPSIKLMMDKLAVGRNTILKGIKNLEEYNIIQVERNNNSTGNFKKQNNIYVLIDKSEWKGYGVPHKDTDNKRAESLSEHDGVPVEDSHGVPVEDIKETHSITETHIKENNASVVSPKTNPINILLGKFKNINSSYEKFFSNPNQRSAIERLIKQHGFEQIGRVIDYLPSIQGALYAPTITTPIQLEDKLAALKSFIQKEKAKGNKNLIRSVKDFQKI